MNRRLKNIFVLLLDILVIGGGVYALYQYLYDSIENIVTHVHLFYEENSFVYFTTLSNIFLMLVSLIDIPIRLMMIIKGTKFTPKWQFVLKLSSAVYIVITFLIVNLVLVFLVEEPYELYEGKEIWTHVILPIAGVVNLMLCSTDTRLRRRVVFLTQIPIAVYSVWYLLMVFILKVWQDFYSIGFWYPYSLGIFVIALFGMSVGIATLFYKLKNGKINKIVRKS